MRQVDRARERVVGTASASLLAGSLALVLAWIDPEMGSFLIWGWIVAALILNVGAAILLAHEELWD